MEDLTRERVMEMKVTELRDALGSRNMSKTGIKADLQSRLLEALEDKKEKKGPSKAEEKEEREAAAEASPIEQDGAGDDDNNAKEKTSIEQAELPLTESNLEKQLPQESGAGVHRYRSTDSCDTSLESRMANIDASSEREEIRSMSSVVGSEDGPNPHRAASVAQSEGEGASATEVRSVTEDSHEDTGVIDRPAANAVGRRGERKGKKADDDDDAGAEKTSTAAGRRSSQPSGSSSSSKPAQASKASPTSRKGAAKATTAKDSDPPPAHQETTTKKESDAAPSASEESTTNRPDASPSTRQEAPAKSSNAAPATRTCGPVSAPKKLVASAINAATGGVGRTGQQREKELLKELKSKMPPPAVKKATSTGGSEASKADGSDIGEASAAKGAPAQGGGETQEVPPAQNPVSCTIRVDGFVRPFTLPAAKKLLVEVAGGPMVDDGFWMDAIKTHCFATFGSEEHASRAREALYNRVWPERGGTLKTEFSDKTAAQVCKEAQEAKAARANAQAASKAAAPPTAAAAAAAPQPSAVASPRGAAPPSSLSRSASDLSGRTGTTGSAVNGGAPETGRRKRELGPSPEPDKRLRLDQSASGGTGIGGGGAAGRPAGAAMPSLDELFRSTKTKPKLYYLPLSEELVAVKRKQKEELKVKRKEQKRAKT